MAVTVIQAAKAHADASRGARADAAVMASRTQPRPSLTHAPASSRVEWAPPLSLAAAPLRRRRGRTARVSRGRRRRRRPRRLGGASTARSHPLTPKTRFRRQLSRRPHKHAPPASSRHKSLRRIVCRPAQCAARPRHRRRRARPWLIVLHAARASCAPVPTEPLSGILASLPPL